MTSRMMRRRVASVMCGFLPRLDAIPLLAGSRTILYTVVRLIPKRFATTSDVTPSRTCSRMLVRISLGIRTPPRHLASVRVDTGVDAENAVDPHIHAKVAKKERDCHNYVTPLLEASAGSIVKPSRRWPNAVPSTRQLPMMLNPWVGFLIPQTHSAKDQKYPL